MAGRNSFGFGRDTEEARTSLFVGASKATLTSFEVGDTRLTRSLLDQSGTKLIGSHRSTTPWEHGNAETYKQFSDKPRLQEAERSPFGRMLHAKIGTFTRRGEERFFIGTGNMTETGLAASAPARYDFFKGLAGDKTQFNYYVSGNKPEVLSQFKQVLNNIESNRTPVSTENLIVVSPNSTNAVSRFTAIIGDKNNHNSLFISSATMTDPRMLEAILAKARRGDHVYALFGGTKQAELDMQKDAMKALMADPRLRKNVHTAYAIRPWHANLIAMGNVFAIGSNRYSKRGLEGELNPDGSRSFGTEVTYTDRDKAVAQDIARHIQQNAGFGSDANPTGIGSTDGQPHGFTKFGTYLPAMTPVLNTTFGGKRGWSYLFDPASVFDSGVRRQYGYLAGAYEGQFRNPMTTSGRMMKHLYTEMYFNRNGTLPGSVPESVEREDQTLMMPTNAEVLNGALTGWAQTALGDEAARLVNDLTQKRGNRGPLGTLLVNAGMTLDRAVYNRNFNAVLTSMMYQQPDAKPMETFASSARFLSDTAFNLGAGLAVANFTVALGSAWNGGWSHVGSLFRYANDVLQTAPASGVRSPLSATAASGAELAGRGANWWFRFEGRFSKAIWEVLEPSIVAFGGQEGHNFVSRVKGIYDQTEVSHSMVFKDQSLADDVMRQLDGTVGGASGIRRPSTLKAVPVGRTNFYEVSWATRMTYIDRFRLVSKEVFGALGQIPGLGWFANNIRVEADAYEQGARAYRRRMASEIFTGQFGRASQTAGDLFDHSRNANTYRLHEYGAGGAGAFNVLARKSARFLMFGALTSLVVGKAMSAPAGTVEDQIDALNDINEGKGKRAVGSTSYFKPIDYMPTGPLDLVPSLWSASLGAVAWGAQFAASLTMGLGLSSSYQRTNKMLSTPTGNGSYQAMQFKSQARIKQLDSSDLLGSIGSVVGYGTELLTAAARDAQMAITSRTNGDLFYKVVTKQMATSMQINEVMRVAYAEAAKMPAGENRDRQLAEIERTVEQARQWSGQKDKAEIAMVYSQGVRIGHLGLFGMWGGSITSGAKTTFMMSVIGTMPFEFGFGMKLPVFYSPKRGKDMMQQWYNERKSPDNPLDALFRSAIDAGGGEYGYFGGVAKQVMSFGPEPGSNWESLLRLNVNTVALIQNVSLGAFVPAGIIATGVMAHRQAGFAEAAQGLTPRTASQRVGDYMRTGHSVGKLGYYGATPYIADNIANSFVNWTTSRGANANLMTRLGFVMKMSGAALRVPFVAPVAVPAWIVGRGLEATGWKGPTWKYNESGMARAVRGYKAGVGVAMLGFTWYAGTQVAIAVDRSMHGDGKEGSGDAAYNRHNAATQAGLRGLDNYIPGLGLTLARAYKEIVNQKDVTAGNPEDATRYAGTPFDSAMGGEAVANIRKGKFEASSAGLWSALTASAKQVFGMVKVGGFQTGEFTLGQTGPNWAWDKTKDPDTSEIGTSVFRFNSFNGLVAAGHNFSARIVDQPPTTDVDAFLAGAIGGNRKWLMTHMPAKRPAFMGKMFLAESAVYNATPSLKIALQVRFLQSRAALSTWPAESKFHAGEMGPGKLQARQLNFAVYTALRSDAHGRVLGFAKTGEDRIRRLIGGIEEGKNPMYVLKETAAKKLILDGGSASSRSAFSQNRLSGASEVDDDYEEMFSETPRAPGSYLLRDPLTSKTMVEFGLNFPNNQRELYNQAIYGVMAGTVGLLIAGGTAFKSVHERFYRRDMHGNRYHDSVEQRVNRYRPTERARSIGVTLSAAEDALGGFHGTGLWVLSANQSDNLLVALPRLGGGGVTLHGDASGTPFSTTGAGSGNAAVRPGTTLQTGAKKAQFFVTKFNDLLGAYLALPSNVQTVGGAARHLTKVETTLNQLRDASHQGGVNTTAIDEVLASLVDLRNRIAGTGASGASTVLTTTLNQTHAKEVELLLRGVLDRADHLANLGAADGGTILRETGHTGFFGTIKAAIASFGLSEGTLPSPHAPARGRGIPRVPVERVAMSNNPEAGYAQTRAMLRDRLGHLGGRAVGLVRSAPSYALLAAKKSLFVVQGAFAVMDIASVSGGMAAEASSDEYLNSQQKEAFRDSGTDSVMGLTGLAGALAVGAAFGFFMPAVGVGIALVGGLGSGLLAGTASETARRNRVEPPKERGNFDAFSDSWFNASENLIKGGGHVIRDFAGPQMGHATVHSLTNLQLQLTNSLRSAAKNARPTNPQDWVSMTWATMLASAAEATRNVIAPVDRAFPELNGNTPGRSFSLSPLWSSRSPIWWGPNEGNGTGWIKDVWEAREKPKQEHMRISADPIGGSLPEMVSPDTLGFMSTSNEAPNRYTHRALYMGNGRGSGGLGSAQTARAFQWKPIASVDTIINAELHRRSIMFEVGILGGVLSRREYRQVGGTGYAGGFVGRPSTGSSGTGPSTGGWGGRGSSVNPASPNDLVAAIRGVNTPMGGGPNSAHVVKWNPMIESSAAKYKIPSGMIRAIMSLESGGRTDATSWAGAIGLMQVMPSHFRERGITGDRRYDPATNIDVGASIFAGYYHRMQKRIAKLNLPPERVLALAVASYNTGPNWNSYDKGEFPASWDGYSTGKSYSDIVMKRYNQTKSTEKPVFTANQQKQLESLLPQYVAGRTGLYLDDFIHQKTGWDQKESKRVAYEVRRGLMMQNKWLPMDDPGVWNNAPGVKNGVGKASMGLVPNIDDKADAVMSAAGFTRPGGLVPGVTITRDPHKGYKVPVIDGWQAVWTDHAGASRDGGARRHAGEDVVYFRKTKDGGWSKSNAPVPAYGEGTVHVGSGGGYGNYVTLDVTSKGGDIYRILYGHGERPLVKDGQKVKAGEALMIQGNTGSTQGVAGYQAIHVHMQFYKIVNGQRQDITPAAFYAANPLVGKPDPKAQEALDRIKGAINLPEYRGFDVTRLMQNLFHMKPDQAAKVHDRYDAHLARQGFYTGPVLGTNGKPMDLPQRFPNAGRSEIARPDEPDFTADEIARGDQANTFAIAGVVVSAAAIWLGRKWSNFRGAKTAAQAAAATSTAAATQSQTFAMVPRSKLGRHGTGGRFAPPVISAAAAATAMPTAVHPVTIVPTAAPVPVMPSKFTPAPLGRDNNLDPSDSFRDPVKGTHHHTSGIGSGTTTPAGLMAKLAGAAQPPTPLTPPTELDTFFPKFRGPGSGGTATTVGLMAQVEILAQPEPITQFRHGDSIKPNKSMKRSHMAMTREITRSLIPGQGDYTLPAKQHAVEMYVRTSDGLNSALADEVGPAPQFRPKRLMGDYNNDNFGFMSNRKLLHILEKTAVATTEDRYVYRHARVGETSAHNNTVISTSQVDPRTWTFGENSKASYDGENRVFRIKVAKGTRIIDLNDPNSPYAYSENSKSGYSHEQEVIILRGQSENLTYKKMRGYTTGKPNGFKMILPQTVNITPFPQGFNLNTLIPTPVSDSTPTAIPSAELLAYDASPFAWKPLGSVAGTPLDSTPTAIVEPVVASAATVTPAPKQAPPPRWHRMLAGRLSQSQGAAAALGAAMSVFDVATLNNAKATKEEKERASFNIAVVGTATTLALGAVAANAVGISKRLVGGLSGAATILGTATLLPDAYGMVAGKTVQERQRAGWNYTVGATAAVVGMAIAGTAAVVAMAPLAAAAVVAGAGLGVVGVAYGADWASGDRISKGIGKLTQTGADTITSLPQWLGNTGYNLGYGLMAEGTSSTPRLAPATPANLKVESKPQASPTGIKPSPAPKEILQDFSRTTIPTPTRKTVTITMSSASTAKRDHGPNPGRQQAPKVSVQNKQVTVKKPSAGRRGAVDSVPQSGGYLQGAVDVLYRWGVRAGL